MSKRSSHLKSKKKNRIEKNSNGENIIRGSNQTVEKLN